MSGWPFPLSDGQGPFEYPPTPRRGTIALPEPEDVLPGQNGRRQAMPVQNWAPRPLTPPPSPRGPEAYYALHLPMIQLAMGNTRIALLAPAYLDTTHAATDPELARVVLRFPSLGSVPRVTLTHATAVAVGDVLAAAERVLNAHGAALRARFPGHRVLTLRVEWVGGDVFDVIISPGY